MTIRCKGEIFFDVVDAYICVFFPSDNPLEVSDVSYSLELIREHSFGFMHTYSGFMTEDLSKASSVLYDLQRALKAGFQEWEVPV